jgi:hypothetical protein
MGVIDIILAKFWLHGRREGPGGTASTALSPSPSAGTSRLYIGGFSEQKQENQHHLPRLLGRRRALASGMAVAANAVKVLDFIITPTFAHTVQLSRGRDLAFADEI